MRLGRTAASPTGRPRFVRRDARLRLLLVTFATETRGAQVSELRPDQVAEPIGVIQVALLEDLFVQARAVEAGGERSTSGWKTCRPLMTTA